MRDLTKPELELVSGGQTNSITATLVATPTTASVSSSQSGAGVSRTGSATSGPGRANTTIDVTESNSIP
jgi:hypothetical protein